VLNYGTYNTIKMYLLCENHAMKAYWGNRGITPRILKLGTRRMRVVSFTPWTLYPEGKNLRYPFDRGLGGSQSQSWHGGKGQKNPSLPLPGVKPRPSSTTELPSLFNRYNNNNNNNNNNNPDVVSVSRVTGLMCKNYVIVVLLLTQKGFCEIYYVLTPPKVSL
jgi:hypothetical protein